MKKQLEDFMKKRIDLILNMSKVIENCQFST